MTYLDLLRAMADQKAREHERATQRHRLVRERRRTLRNRTN